MSENLGNRSEKDFRLEQSEKVVEFLDRSGSFEYFQEIISGEEVPDFDKFKDFIIRINGIARDIPIAERKFDGTNVGLSGWLGDVAVPKHEDKEELLRYAYEAIPNIAKDDVKYMLPAVMNAVHLFSDGNGRTSRVLHLLLSNYSSKNEFLEEAKKALGEYGRFDSLDINPGLIDDEIIRVVLERNGWVFDDKNPNGKIGPTSEGMGYDVHNFDQDDPKEKLAKKFIDLKDGYYEATATYMLLGDEGLKSLLRDYSSGDRKRLGAISVKKMLETLSIDDWQKLIDNFYQLKREQVQTLVDVFKNPKKYKSSRKGEKRAIKDIFIEDIKRQKDSI